MNPRKKATPGSPLRVPANTWNDLLDVLETRPNSPEQQLISAKWPYRDLEIVLAVIDHPSNTNLLFGTHTPVLLPRGEDAFCLNRPQWLDPYTLPGFTSGFLNRPLMVAKSTIFIADYPQHTCGVLLDSGRHGSVVRVAVKGVVAARIMLPPIGTELRAVQLGAGGFVRAEWPNKFGTHRVVWWEPKTQPGEASFALISLNDWPAVAADLRSEGILTEGRQEIEGRKRFRSIVVDPRIPNTDSIGGLIFNATRMDADAPWFSETFGGVRNRAVGLVADCFPHTFLSHSGHILSICYFAERGINPNTSWLETGNYGSYLFVSSELCQSSVSAGLATASMSAGSNLGGGGGAFRVSTAANSLCELSVQDGGTNLLPSAALRLFSQAGHASLGVDYDNDYPRISLRLGDQVFPDLLLQTTSNPTAPGTILAINRTTAGPASGQLSLGVDSAGPFYSCSGQRGRTETINIPNTTISMTFVGGILVGSIGGTGPTVIDGGTF